jgi:uncharacterized protein YdeI (YjbR/CyaY-like superfamily)
VSRTEEQVEVIFFATATELRAWLEERHTTASELWIGFYKKASGIGGVTYAQALNEALCHGWIDGVRRRVDERSFTNRFTPRKPGSNWSAVNIARVEELTRLGLMRPAGLAAFERRTDLRSQVYSYEQASAALDADMQRRFRADAQAWAFFTAQAPSYQRTAIWWVMSAKQDATRQRRLATLIADSAAERRLAQVTYTPKG